MCCRDPWTDTAPGSSHLALPAMPIATLCLGTGGKPSPKLFGAGAASLEWHSALQGSDTSLLRDSPTVRGKHTGHDKFVPEAALSRILSQ